MSLRDGNYNPDDYYTDGGNINYFKIGWDYLQELPAILGEWIGTGVNAYTQSSTQFEREWNSPANQMEQYADAGVNPYEGFLQGSGGSGNRIATASGVDPLATMGQYISNFISLAHALQDLRSKKLSNASSAIDLARKSFENRFFFGDEGTPFTEETVDENGNPIVTVGRKGYIMSAPELEYRNKFVSYGRNQSQAVKDKYDARKYSWGLNSSDNLPEEDIEAEIKGKKFGALNAEYNANRNKMSFEWEKFLKDDLGLDPRSSPWLTTFMNVVKNQSENDSPFGRFLFGILKFLKGEY